MQKFYFLLVYFILNTVYISCSDYDVTLVSDSPIVRGANLTVNATLYYDDDIASGTFFYKWTDDGVPRHKREIEKASAHDTWVLNYDEKIYPQGPYIVQVEVQKSYIDLYWTIASNRLEIIVTGTLNGNLALSQKNVTRDEEYVSSKDPVRHEIKLKKSDDDFIKQATTLRTFWFIDCTYYGFTNNLTFDFVYSEPEKKHIIEALVVADFTPPPPPTTTTTTTTTTTSTTTTTTPTPSKTTTVTPTSSSKTTTAKPSTTIVPHTTTTTTPIPSYTTRITIPTSGTSTTSQASTASKSTITGASSRRKRYLSVTTEKSAEKKHGSNLKMVVNGTIVPYDDRYGDFPYICNSTKIAEDPDKTYGYFVRSIKVKEPISSVNVTGNNWIQHGDMVSLSVKCLGSKEIKYCVLYKTGSYNVTGNESCSYYQELDTCSFEIERFFIEPIVHTIVIILKNEVSKVVQPVTVTVYKVSKQGQLSVIVVPVASSLVAVVLIVFGVAYYFQNRSRFIVEVADFNFSQQYNDLEYKTFRERLRDSITNAFNRAPSPTNSEAPTTWPPNRKYGSMT